MENNEHDIDKLNEKIQDAVDKFHDRRALIFIEEAIAYYNERHGIEKTIHYLKEMIDFLESI